MEGRDQGGKAVNTRPRPRRQIHGQGGKAAGAHMQDGQVCTARPSGQHVERGTAMGAGGSLQQEKARRVREAHAGRRRGPTGELQSLILAVAAIVCVRHTLVPTHPQTQDPLKDVLSPNMAAQMLTHRYTHTCAQVTPPPTDTTTWADTQIPHAFTVISHPPNCAHVQYLLTPACV